MKLLPCISVADLTEPEIRVFRSTEIRLVEHSEWNDDQLAEDFQALCDLEIYYSLNIYEYSASERKRLLNKFHEIYGEPDSADILGDIGEVPVVCQNGDLWKLGNHLLLCGDATVPNSYKLLLGLDKVAMVVADLPTNVSAQNLGKDCVAQHKNYSVDTGTMAPNKYQ